MRALVEFLSYTVPLGVLVLDLLQTKRGGCCGEGGRAGEMRVLILKTVLTLG
jgi:hypothetical protein